MHLAAAGEGEGVIGATRDPCKVYAFQRFEYARVACAAALLPYAWTVHAHFAGHRPKQAFLSKSCALGMPFACAPCATSASLLQRIVLRMHVILVHKPLLRMLSCNTAENAGCMLLNELQDAKLEVTRCS